MENANPNNPYVRCLTYIDNLFGGRVDSGWMGILEALTGADGFLLLRTGTIRMEGNYFEITDSGREIAHKAGHYDLV